MSRFLVRLISRSIDTLNAVSRGLGALREHIEREISEDEGIALLMNHARGYVRFIDWNLDVMRETIKECRTRTEVLAACERMEAIVMQLPKSDGSIAIPPKIRVFGMSDQLAAEIDNWIDAHERMLDDINDPVADEMFKDYKEMIRRGPMVRR